MHPLLYILLLLFNNTNTNEPVRLAKKQEKPRRQYHRNKDLEIIIIGLIITLIAVSILLICVTSCTDSGLIYNNLNGII